MKHRFLNDDELRKIDYEEDMIHNNINMMIESHDLENLYHNCKSAFNRILYICSIVENKFKEI